MKTLFTSTADEIRQHREILTGILVLLRQDPDLLGQLRVLMKVAEPETPAASLEAQVPSPVADVPPTADPPQGSPEAVAATPAPADGKQALSPTELRPPNPDEQADAYMTDVVRAAGWDPLMWAMAVIEFKDWIWGDDKLVDQVRKWARAVIDSEDSGQTT